MEQDCDERNPLRVDDGWVTGIKWDGYCRAIIEIIDDDGNRVRQVHLGARVDGDFIEFVFEQ